MPFLRRDDTNAISTATRGVLIAVGGNELDDEVIRLACALVKSAKAPLYAVHVIEMPWTEAVDELPDDRVTIEADTVLDRATRSASACGYRLEAELLQARAAGAAIVDEAAARACDLIVVGLPYKRLHGQFTLGETVPYVLEYSPVPVWVVRGRPK